jgi:hypothetical protein
MSDHGFHAAEIRIGGLRYRKDTVTVTPPGCRMMERRVYLCLLRYRQVAIDMRAVVDLLHG